MNNIYQHRAEKIHHKIHRHAREHIHRISQRPDSHKKVYAFSVAFVVTATVFMLWYFLSLPKILETYNVTKSENERLGNNPLNDIKDVFNGEMPEDGVSISDTNIEINQ